MGARTKARKRALDVLYEAELRGVPVREVLEDRRHRPGAPLPEYAVTLVEGVVQNQARIDELIERYAVGWTLDRMPAVDRNILRLGAYELLWVDDVPPGVAISEAVFLARDLSTEESPHFVNGLLAKIGRLDEAVPRA